jgi:hypothetical protein
MVPAPMGNAYTPGLQVTGRTTVRKTRRLPLSGIVLAKVGDTVAAEQVVARTELPGKVYPLNVANQLSIPADEVPEAMKKQVGQHVAKDELLAETRSFFGLFRSDVKAPIDGTIESISKVTGQVLLREAPIPVEVTAYIPGRVVEEIANEGVVVEAEASYIQGIFGLGGEVNAPLRSVAKAPDEVIEEGRIDDGCRGHILIGGSQLTLPALRRCLSVGAAGVICGGFAYQDIKELLGYDIGVAITGGEKLGTTLMITEGFGRIDMARATFELLTRNDGKPASMNGATQIRAGVIRPEVIIPAGAAAAAEAGAAATHFLDLGASVRCIRAPHFGRIGTVTALPAALTKMPSETMVRVVEVTLEGGEKVALPRANVELIERGAG